MLRGGTGCTASLRISTAHRPARSLGVQVRSLDPCTHAYSFWEGVPVEGKAAFGALFAASRTLRSVAVVQRAIRWAADEDAWLGVGGGNAAQAQAGHVSRAVQAGACEHRG